jgi:hypothetical protein
METKLRGLLEVENGQIFEVEGFVGCCGERFEGRVVKYGDGRGELDLVLKMKREVVDEWRLF